MSTLLFTELELDAMMEIFNIGFGYAADSLSKMVNDQVCLSLPGIRIIHRDDADQEFQQGAPVNFCGVIQRFKGDFQANAVLMFPGNNSLELVRLMVGDMVALEDMSDLEQEALTEVGNILLNSCVSAMSDAVGVHFHSSMPKYVSGAWSDIFPKGGTDTDQIILLNIDFRLERREIHGYMMFMMQLNSIEQFKITIMKYMNQFA